MCAETRVKCCSPSVLGEIQVPPARPPGGLSPAGGRGDGGVRAFFFGRSAYYYKASASVCDARRLAAPLWRRREVVWRWALGTVVLDVLGEIMITWKICSSI